MPRWYLVSRALYWGGCFPECETNNGRRIWSIRIQAEPQSHAIDLQVRCERGYPVHDRRPPANKSFERDHGCILLGNLLDLEGGQQIDNRTTMNFGRPKRASAIRRVHSHADKSAISDPDRSTRFDRGEPRSEGLDLVIAEFGISFLCGSHHDPCIHARICQLSHQTHEDRPWLRLCYRLRPGG